MAFLSGVHFSYRLTLQIASKHGRYRFNGHDQRLHRMLQTTCMIMEAFENVSQGKVVYEIVGHSGESPEVMFVKSDAPPTNDNERLQVLRAMHAHAQYCMSGPMRVLRQKFALEECH
jgi:hypothetical protein